MLSWLFCGWPVRFSLCLFIAFGVIALMSHAVLVRPAAFERQSDKHSYRCHSLDDIVHGVIRGLCDDAGRAKRL
jgi:hypothetical protein